MLAAIPFCVNLGIFIYVFFRLPGNKLNITFSLFLTTLYLWQLADTMVRLSDSEETARLWYNMLSPMANFVPSTALHFTLLFTRRRHWLNRPWVLIAMYAPALFFSIATIGGLIGYEISPSPFWKWSLFPANNLLTYINAYWIGLLSWIVMVILIIYAIKSRKAGNLGKQAMLVAIGYAIPNTQGICTELLFPYLFNIPPIPATSFFMSAFSVCIIIALTRYHLFTYSPRHVWSSIVNTMNEGIMIVNNNDIIQYANNKLSEITGYTAEELVGRSAQHLFLAESDREVANNAIKRRKQLISDKYQLPLVTKNGKQIWCEISGSPYVDYDGNVTGSVGMITDITQRKMIEDALKQSEKRYSKFIRHSLSAIFLVDPATGIIIDANSAFFKLLGYSRKAIGQLTTYDVATARREEVDALIQQVIKEKGQIAGERKWQTKTGAIVDVLVSTTYVEQDGNKIIFVVGNDISQRVMLEKRLVQKIQDMNTFIYRVSHDLRSPLASVIGLVNVATREVQEKKTLPYLTMIGESTARLDRILQELIDITVITQGRIKNRPVCLRSEVSQVFASLSQVPNHSRITFDVGINLSSPLVTDRSLLISILQNLISNSIKYADLTKSRQLLTVTAERVNGRICIKVTDNGTGIPASAHSEVFSMFHRAHESSNGTGLGLFIARSAVEKLGGEISFQSKEGEGTTFTFFLPVRSKKIAT